MNEGTFSVRRIMCVAVVLAVAGAHGCGVEDAGPADDEFRHTHVLASEQQQPKNVLSLTSPDHRGWTPSQFQTAYGLNLVQPANSRPLGYGIKVAIIVAYHYANMQADLNKFAQVYSLKPITLNIINQAGNVANYNWALETAVNVQMMNAVIPGATVYVIEAKTVSQADIRTAMSTAQNLGVNVIVMSFAASEPASQTLTFTPARGIVWIAPSGDSDRPSFPATHPGVIAVGGTVARLSPTNVLSSETAWVDAGAGMSTVQELPSFQKIPSVQQLNTTSHRSIPDVAFHADPDSGASIYSNGSWFVVGGTTVSTAFFAGVVAIANQARKTQSKPMLTSISGSGATLQDSLYNLMSTHGGPTNSTILNDVVDGSAGEGGYAAGPGYDIATGLGSLDVPQFVDYIAAQP